MKRAALQIKKIASSRSASISDSEKYLRIQRKKRANTGVLLSNKTPKRVHRRHYGTHCYCVLCNKAGMTEHKYTSHSDKDCTGVHNNWPIKYEMGGPMGSRTDAVKQYNKSGNKQEKDLKDIKKQNKILYRISEKPSSHREIKKIKQITEKAYMKTNDYSSDDLESDSSLARGSSL